MRLLYGLSLSFVVAAGVAASATDAELPLRQIVESLFNAKPGVQLDFSGKDLSLLDLSGVDFKQANLAGANMLGDDLSGANLSHVNLAGAKLDRTTLARANFNGADLSRATLFDAVGSLTFESPAANAPTFAGAKSRACAHFRPSRPGGFPQGEFIGRASRHRAQPVQDAEADRSLRRALRRSKSHARRLNGRKPHLR